MENYQQMIKRHEIEIDALQKNCKHKKWEMVNRMKVICSNCGVDRSPTDKELAQWHKDNPFAATAEDW